MATKIANRTSNGTIKLFPRTLSHKDVPNLFQEPHVLSGYRMPNQPWSYYVTSLFQLHNELFNVWTHVLAFGVSVYKLFGYLEALPLTNHHSWPFLTGYLTCLTQYLASIGAHLFHSQNELSHYIAFQMDYCGIGLHGLGSGFHSLFYAGEQGYFDAVQSFYMPVLVVLSLNVCFCNGYFMVKYDPPYPLIRKVAQVLGVVIMYIWVSLPLVPRFYHCALQIRDGFATSLDTCDASLGLHAKMIACLIAAGVFFGSNMPQCFFPGKCDLVGHGHQIFHVFVMATTFFANEAIFIDANNKRHLLDYRVPSSLVACLWPVVVVASGEAMITVALTRMAARKVNLKAKDA